MQQLSYESIAPLIQDLQVRGRTVNVLFVCPVSQERIQARHNMPINRSAGSRITKTAQRSAMYAAQNAIYQVIRSVFGYNLLGRVASDVARQTVYAAGNTNQNSLSGAEQKQAVVHAFQSVSSRFAWDSNHHRWISASALKDSLSPFELQLQKAPIKHPYDKSILSRMLVQVAVADGELSAEEEDWLASFIDPQQGSIQSIIQRPPLSSAEMSQASSGSVRETMLMLSWSLALCDENFASQEKALLQRFSADFGLSMQQVKLVREAAQGYILDQAMESIFGWGGHDQYARQKIFELAKNLGMTTQAASLAEARFQRRRSGTF